MPVAAHHASARHAQNETSTFPISRALSSASSSAFVQGLESLNPNRDTIISIPVDGREFVPLDQVAGALIPQINKHALGIKNLHMSFSQKVQMSIEASSKAVSETINVFRVGSMLDKAYIDEFQILVGKLATNVASIHNACQSFEAMTPTQQKIKSETFQTEITQAEKAITLSTKSIENYRYSSIIRKINIERMEQMQKDRLLQCLEYFDESQRIEDYYNSFVDGTRRWFFEKFHAWLGDRDTKHRVFVLAADAGMGKTAIASKVVMEYPEQVAASHFCRHDHDSLSSPKRMLMSFASQLATKLPEDYKVELLEHLERFGAPLDDVDEEEGMEWMRLRAKLLDPKTSIKVVFEELLGNPLSRCPMRIDPILIVLDALDEVGDEGKSQLLRCIESHFADLPRWVRVFITTRPQSPAMDIERESESVEGGSHFSQVSVTGRLRKFNPYLLEPEDENNQYDLRVFYIVKLSNFCDGSGQSLVNDMNAAVDVLMEKTKGNFIYAHYAMEWLRLILEERNEVTMITLEEMPDGLDGFYKTQFERLFKDRVDSFEYKESLEWNAIRLIVAAAEPLHAKLLRVLLDCDEKNLRDLSNSLSVFFPKRGDRFLLHHKSLKDWLTDPSRELDHFHFSLSSANALLGHCCLEKLHAISDDFVDEDEVVCVYLLKHTVYHLLDSGLYAAARGLLLDIGFVMKRVKMVDDLRVIGEECLLLGKKDDDRLMHYVGRAFQQAQGVSRRSDGRQLPSQVVGRLLGLVDEGDVSADLMNVSTRWSGQERLPSSIHEELKDVIERWKNHEYGFDWWCPLSPSWEQADHPCLMVLSKADKSWVELLSDTPDMDWIVSPRMNWHPDAWARLMGGSLDPILEMYSRNAECLSWSPDGKYCVSVGSWDETLCVWEVSSSTCLHILKGHTHWVLSTAWSPDSQFIVSGSKDDTLRIWLASSGECLHVLEGHTDWVNSVSWSPNGQMIASGSNDRTLRIWNASPGECLRVLEGHSLSVNSVSWSPEGHIVISASWDKTLRLWEATSGNLLQVLQGHTSGVDSVSWSPDGQKIASGSQDKTIRIWETSSGKILDVLEGHFNFVDYVNWSPDGRRIISFSSSRDGTLQIWEAAAPSAKPLGGRQEGHSGKVYSIAWSPDGTSVASSSRDKTIRIWDPTLGRFQRMLQGHTGPVSSVSWSPDGSKIASGSWDKTMFVWDATSGKCGHILRGHADTVNCVSWSPDGTRVASGSNDKTVRVWAAMSGDIQQVLEGHRSGVYSIAWATDGTNRVASLGHSSHDDNSPIWNEQAFNGTNQIAPYEVHQVEVRIWDVASATCLSVYDSREETRFPPPGFEAFRPIPENFGTITGVGCDEFYVYGNHAVGVYNRKDVLFFELAGKRDIVQQSNQILVSGEGATLRESTTNNEALCELNNDYRIPTREAAARQDNPPYINKRSVEAPVGHNLNEQHKNRERLAFSRHTTGDSPKTGRPRDDSRLSPSTDLALMENGHSEDIDLHKDQMVEADDGDEEEECAGTPPSVNEGFLPKLRTPRSHCTAVSISDTRIAVMGGRRHDWDLAETVEVLDMDYPEENHQLPDLDPPRTSCSAVMVDSCVYILGGFYKERLTNMCRLDVTESPPRWTHLHHPMPSALTNFAAITRTIPHNKHNQIIVVGGLDDSDFQNAMYGFDVEATKWTTLAPMRVKRESCGAAVVGSKLYVFGGRTYDENDRDRPLIVEDSVEIYDFEKSMWSLLPKPMREKRYGCAVVSIQEDGIILVVGGHNGDEALRSVEVFDTNTQTWQCLPDMCSERFGGDVVRVGDKVVAVGGVNIDATYVNFIDVIDFSSPMDFPALALPPPETADKVSCITPAAPKEAVIDEFSDNVEEAITVPNKAPETNVTNNNSFLEFGGTHTFTRTIELIKENEFSRVYKGTRRNKHGAKRRQDEVAVKVFQDQEDWTRVQEELMIMLRLPQHPNVMLVYNFYQVPVPAYVMELFEGENLHDHVNLSGGFVPKDAEAILRDIGSGVKHLHEHQVVHRDLKPANILLQQLSETRYRPVIIGLSAAATTRGTGRADSTDGGEEGIGGTLPWIAPELLQPAPEWSDKSDMYAIGHIMWEVLTGQVPFDRLSSREIREAIVAGERPDLELLREVIPQSRINLIEALWHVNPERRPSANEFLELLDGRESVTTIDRSYRFTREVPHSNASTGAVRAAFARPSSIADETQQDISTPENRKQEHDTTEAEEALLVFGNKTRVTKLLVETSHSKVYFGIRKHKESRQKVAVKVFQDQVRWQEELRNLLRLPDHPNVMDILEFYQVPRLAFVMRYIDGGNLRKHLDTHGRFAQEEAKEILLGIGNGLKHLHQHGVVHRDVKSHNIVLEKFGNNSRIQPVLIDFGVGRIVSKDFSHAITEAPRGTTAWIAPEMMYANTWSYKTDMYSLGIVMWEILTGQEPFQGIFFYQIAIRIAEGERPDIGLLDEVGASEGQKNLVKQLWSQDPRGRPDADKFVDLITNL